MKRRLSDILAEIDSAYAEGRIDAARCLVASGLQDYPASVGLLLRESQCEEARGDRDAAARALEKAHRLSPLLKRAAPSAGQNEASGSTAAKPGKRVSIIIPLYNQVAYTAQCLEALAQNTPQELNFEVVLVDNASSDGTEAFLAQLSGDVVVHRNSENLGFAKACNQGAHIATGEILVFLNNDTIPKPGWLEALIEGLEQPNVGAVGSKLLFPSGLIQHAGVVFDQRGWPYHWQYNQPPSPLIDQERELQAVTAACIAIPRALFMQLGGFDEVFLNGYEDVDLCLKVREAGYRILYKPKSELIHFGSVSEGRGTRESENLRIFLERWATRIVPDYDRFQSIAANRNPVYSVVIVTYNSSATIEACLLSALRTLGPDDEVIVVDNASSDETCEIVESLARQDPRLTLLRSAENLGFSEGSNLGIRRSLGAYVVLLNPDTVVTSGWLNKMSAYFASGKVGAVGPTSDYVAGLQKVGLYLPEAKLAGSSPEQISAELSTRGSQGVETKLLIGFCMMFSRHVLEEVGFLDPELFLGNDDLDMSWRLRQKGYRLLVATDTFVHHVGQVSFNTEPSEKTRRLVQESTDLLARNLVAHYGPGRVPAAMDLWGIDWFTPSTGVLDAHPVTSIVVLTYNQVEVTRLCIESLFQHTRDFELILVDNASTDDTVPYLKALAETHENVKLILNSINRGFAGGCNQGIAAATGRDVVLLNNDTIVTEGWLEGLIEASRTTGADIVGPRTNRIAGPQQVEAVSYDPLTLDGFDAFLKDWRLRPHANWPSMRVIGFCMFIRRHVLDVIGGLDTAFGTGNYEDDDFCMRALVAGFSIVVTDAVFIHHFGSATFKGQKIDYRATLERNWTLFKQKWGLPESLPIEAGYWVDDLISQPFDPLRHTVPLYRPDVTARELPNRQAYNVVLANVTEPWLSRALRAYCDAFDEGESVTLHVLAGHDLERVQARVLDVLDEIGRDPTHIPDISLVDGPVSPLELPGYLRAADLVLASLQVAAGARDMGLPAFEDPTADLLRTARKEFGAVDWSATPVHLEEWTPKRWLVTSPSWQKPLEAFLRVAPEVDPPALYMKPQSRDPEALLAEISEWIVANGNDPETVPDIVLLDVNTESELSLFRFASAWLDTGDARERAIAAALGLEIVGLPGSSGQV